MYSRTERYRFDPRNQKERFPVLKIILKFIGNSRY